MVSGDDDYVIAVGSANAGEGKTLEDAMKNAYDDGKRRTGKTHFRVVEIHLVGDNPISDYKVYVTPV